MSAIERDLGLKWAAATVVDEGRLRSSSGAEMEAMHLGTQTEPIFSVFHRPAVAPRGVVVVCSPPYTEGARNHRRELLFGWFASDKDIAVARFHPRGCGHSGGDTADLTLGTMEEDAQTVAREAVKRLEAPLIGLVGTRLGAVVAHRVARTHPQAAVAWWQPVLSADSYLRELFRAAMIGALKRGVTTNVNELEAQLETEGVVEVLGAPVSRRFYESLLAHSLDNAPSGPRSGLFVQMSRRSELQRHYVTFVRKLTRDGWDVDTLLIPDEETWWFGARGRGAETELREVALEVVPATVDFFASLSAAP